MVGQSEPGWLRANRKAERIEKLWDFCKRAVSLLLRLIVLLWVLIVASGEPLAGHTWLPVTCVVLGLGFWIYRVGADSERRDQRIRMRLIELENRIKDIESRRRS